MLARGDCALGMNDPRSSRDSTGEDEIQLLRNFIRESPSRAHSLPRVCRVSRTSGLTFPSREQFRSFMQHV